MRLIDIQPQKEIDEDWKHAVAAGALALGGLSGGSKVTPPETPAPTQHIQQAPNIISVPNLSGTRMEDILHKKAIKAGIQGEELAQFLAQCAHETMGFTRSREKGTSAYFAKKYDPKHAPTIAKLLGNTKSGDGERFRGTGGLQLSGKYWFNQAEKELGIPLLQHPELADDINIGADLAVWYWKKKVQPHVSNFSDTKSVTKQINPGLDKLERRDQLYKKYIGAAK